MGLSRTVSEINGEFSRKSQFSHPETPPLTGSLGIRYRRQGSKIEEKN